MSKSVLAVILSMFFMAGCASVDKYKEEPSDMLYQTDVNGDDRPEIVLVKDKFDSQSKTIIKVLKKNKLEIDNFSIPGRLKKIEFMQLDISPRKNLSLHYLKKDDSEVVDIYGLKEDKFNKIFTIDSNCGIETDYSSVLARIKVGKFKCDGNVCSCTSAKDGDVWIWAGDRFLKER